MPALIFLILAAVNVATFWGHYAGDLTFPWDFLGGYHAHTFGWYADGGFFNPPLWFPWADLGFPAFWALQSGAWYLPLAALDWAGIHYTVTVATAVQCLQVLFGAAGMCALLRAFAMPWSIALLGGVCYHFTAAFYSNEQHADIVRAAALLPWLLWALYPTQLLRSPVRPLIAAILLFQFLVAAYPGNIVTAGYASVLFCCAALTQLKPWQQLRFIGYLGLAGTGGILMASLKWLPVFHAGDATASAGSLPPNPILLQFLPTLFLPYDVPFLAGDVTMRSLWLPGVVLVGSAFARRDFAVLPGALFVAMALLLGGVVPANFPHQAILPGLQISRFPISDWRPILQIGLILIGCSGWRVLLEGGLDGSAALIRAALVIVCFGLLLWFARGMGYEAPAMLQAGLFTMAALAFALLLVFRYLGPEKSTALLAGIAISCIAALAAADGWVYQTSQARPWRMGWAPGANLQLFGTAPDKFGEGRPLSPNRRPERLVVGETYQDILQNAVSYRYNACWYEAKYCVLGYNNLRLSRPHREISEQLKDPVKGPDLLEYVRRPQQVVIQPPGASFDPAAIVSYPRDDEFISFVPGASGRAKGYGSDRLAYDVSSSVPARIVENEIWAPSWRIRLCDSTHCLNPTPVSHTDQYLRAWDIPAGTWRAELSFGEGLYRSAWIAFWVGLFLVALTPPLEATFRYTRPSTFLPEGRAIAGGGTG